MCPPSCSTPSAPANSATARATSRSRRWRRAPDHVQRRHASTPASSAPAASGRAAEAGGEDARAAAPRRRASPRPPRPGRSRGCRRIRPRPLRATQPRAARGAAPPVVARDAVSLARHHARCVAASAAASAAASPLASAQVNGASTYVSSKRLFLNGLRNAPGGRAAPRHSDRSREGTAPGLLRRGLRAARRHRVRAREKARQREHGRQRGQSAAVGAAVETKWIPKKLTHCRSSLAGPDTQTCRRAARTALRQHYRRPLRDRRRRRTRRHLRGRRPESPGRLSINPPMRGSGRRRDSEPRQAAAKEAHIKRSAKRKALATMARAPSVQLRALQRGRRRGRSM